MARPPRARPARPARCWQALGGLLAGVACAAVLAQAPAAGEAVDAQARVQAGRAEAARRLADETAACMDRFLLTACLQAAQARHREAVAGLDQRQGLLDQAARQARAEQRQQRLAAAAPVPAASASGVSRAAPAGAVASGASPPGALPQAASSTPAPARRPSAAAAAEARQQAAQQKAAEHARRVQAAQAHRDAVLARVQREDAQRPPAGPLPLPLPAVQAAPASVATPVKPGPAGR